MTLHDFVRCNFFYSRLMKMHTVTIASTAKHFIHNAIAPPPPSPPLVRRQLINTQKLDLQVLLRVVK